MQNSSDKKYEIAEEIIYVFNYGNEREKYFH